MNFRAPLALALGLAFPAAAQDPDEVIDALSLAKTIDACFAKYAPAKKTFPTALIRGTSMGAESCTRRVMNVEVDKILVPLKQAQPALFKRGMEAQKRFNEAVKAYCGRWEPYYEKCCSTCSFTEQPECGMAFHAARVLQVHEAIAGTAPAEVKAPSRPRTSLFETYATEWCSFLSEKGVAVDASCSARILNALAARQSDDGAELRCR
jgi:hypothetical protein